MFMCKEILYKQNQAWRSALVQASLYSSYKKDFWPLSTGYVAKGIKISTVLTKKVSNKQIYSYI